MLPIVPPVSVTWPTPVLIAVDVQHAAVDRQAAVGAAQGEGRAHLQRAVGDGGAAGVAVAVGERHQAAPIMASEPLPPMA